MIDLRFYRTYHPGDKNTLIGRNQYRWVEKELIVFYYFMYIYIHQKYENDESIKHIVIVTGVPLLWGNKFYSGIIYAVEKERYTGHKDLFPYTQQLLELIWKYKTKVHLLVGGDHHLYAESLVCYNKTCIPQVYIIIIIMNLQIIASGFTKGSTTGSEFKLSFLQFCVSHFLDYFPDRNWYVKFGEIYVYKNYGVINVNKDEIKWYGVKDDTGAALPFYIYQSMYLLFVFIIMQI